MNSIVKSEQQASVVFNFGEHQVRTAGTYSTRALTPAEQLLATVQIQVDHERQLAA